MVKVIDVKIRENEAGEEFFVLVMQENPRPVISEETGKVYFTTSKANVPTTFDEQTCKSLIGQEFEGTIEKVPCDAYEYTVESTGETIVLRHRNEFVTEQQKIISEQIIEEELVM